METNEQESKGERIRVRKRIRVKKKPNPKKKLKKILRIVAWILVIATFIGTLIVIFSESDIRYENAKKTKSKLDIIVNLPHRF